MIPYHNAPGSSRAGKRIASAGRAFERQVAALAAMPPRPPEPIAASPLWRRPTVILLPGIVPRWIQIMREVAAEADVAVDDIRSESRKAEATRARQAVMYRLRAEEGWALSRIGGRLSRDHTTILHGIAQHCRRHGLPIPPRSAR